MKLFFKLVSLLLVVVILASCSSTTMIQSIPKGAKVFINGEYAGVTPFLHTDTRIVGSSIDVKLEKEGYSPLFTTITKNEELNVGAIVGGIFFTIPFLWVMQYKPSHTYELIPLQMTPEALNQEVTQKPSSESKATKLRELKALLDEKIITPDEFEKEKAKILSEE